MTFNELDDLISQIYEEVDEAYDNRADDLVEKLADALYENRIGRMMHILEEWDAEKWFDSWFYNKLEQGILAYMNPDNIETY